MSLQADGEGRVARSVPIARAATRLVSVVLSVLLAVAMLPAAGLQVAYADEPVERPATSGGDVALESTNSDAAESAPQAPIAEEREGGMLGADGLMYTVADGGLSLVGFDGASPEGALSVPAAVMVDGKETPVVAIDFAEGQVADKVVLLSLPQSIKGIDAATLASAFPALLSVEVASASSTLPVAAGAASVRAAYSASGGMLFRPTSVTFQNEDGSIETVECKELVWAPPALVSARIPVECRAIAEGAFANVRDFKTVVAFGTMERISEGAFSTEQMESAKVVVPASSPAVTDSERVSASMALMGDAGQKERRSAWHEAGWRTDDIVMGKPYGSLTETVAVTEEGTIERDELQLVSYPGAHENAMDIKKPNADGIVEQAESGLAFTVKSDMTAVVTWQGDKTVTPANLDIPATVVIDGVTYPVTEIAPNAFEGAVFLRSVTIPEGVTAIGADAFTGCSGLIEVTAPATLKAVATDAFEGGRIQLPPLPSAVDASSPEASTGAKSADAMVLQGGGISDLQSASGGVVAATDSNGDSISAYDASRDSAYNISVTVACSPGDLDLTVAVTKESQYFTITKVSAGRYGIQYSGPYPLYAAVEALTGCATVVFQHENGYDFAAVSFTPPSGWVCASMSSQEQSRYAFPNNPAEYISAIFVRSEVVGNYSLLTTNALSGTGTALTAAHSDHNHDGTYAKASDLSSYVTTSALDGRNYITKAVSELDNFYDKAKFNTISYEGLDEADYAGALPTFYVNDASKLPKVPEPRREGHEFLGWTWAGQATPTKDPGSAFSGGGAVTLVANWDETEPVTPEAKHFFTSDAPLRHDDASATQTHVIKVRLASSPGTLASVSFEGDDRTGLLRETSGVKLFVGASEDALASGTELPWGGATPSGWECELAKLGEGSYGVYVGVSVPTSAIDEASIPVSYADGSYVASLIKMNYAFA